ncbi:MAG TPA: hypothetical protein VGF13_01105, partial [Verrucomicrobiae bacterium]
ANIRDELREAGKLEPYKQTVSRKLGRLIDASLNNMIRKAEKGELPANVEAIALCAWTDKKGQVDAGVVPGTELREPELDPEVLRRQWQEMKRAKVIDVQTPDKQSDAGLPKPS